MAIAGMAIAGMAIAGMAIAGIAAWGRSYGAALRERSSARAVGRSACMRRLVERYMPHSPAEPVECWPSAESGPAGATRSGIYILASGESRHAQ